ncbi:MAG: hypothetical protein RR639_05370 [Hydrogenoanaerobacterium sp.]
MKKALVMILTLTIMLSCTAPVFFCASPTLFFDSSVQVLDSSVQVLDSGAYKPLPITIALKQSFEGYGIFVTLPDMSEDMTSIIPCYSFDDIDYTAEDYNALLVDLSQKTQQCFWSMESPLLEYLAGKKDKFYIKLKITYQNGIESMTQSACISRSLEEQQLPADCNLAAWYDTPIRTIQYNPLKIFGQYHFTVPANATPAELAALLPAQVPVELQITQNRQKLHNELVKYYVEWPTDISLSGATTKIAAVKLTPPQEIKVSIGEKTYSIKKTESIHFDGPELFVSFHAVDKNTKSTLLLDETTNGLRATLPLKPTGAKEILPEYSVDGGKSWVSTQDILHSSPLTSYPPRFESYTAPILDCTKAPMKDYCDKKISGFLVRLKINGGAFDGLTEPAKWPADYVYTPPRDDTNDDGGTGNNGNIGAGGGESNSGGQRPSLPQENNTSTLPPNEITVNNGDITPLNDLMVVHTEKPSALNTPPNKNHKNISLPQQEKTITFNTTEPAAGNPQETDDKNNSTNLQQDTSGMPAKPAKEEALQQAPERKLGASRAILPIAITSAVILGGATTIIAGLSSASATAAAATTATAANAEKTLMLLKRLKKLLLHK